MCGEWLFLTKLHYPQHYVHFPHLGKVHNSWRGKYAWTGTTVPVPTAHTQTANLSIAAKDAYIIKSGRQ